MKQKLFNDFFNKEVKKESEKFTILLGSSFHKVNGNISTLTNWDLLLEKIDKNYKSSGNYLLDFEKIICNEQSVKPASSIEKIHLAEIARSIKDEQNNLSVDLLKKYPIYIFNPKYVSDLIILNYDTVAENICSKLLSCKLSNLKYVNIDTKLSKNTKIHQSTKYIEVTFPHQEIIRFWHPHGSIAKPSDMIFSARSYAVHLGMIERLRDYSKTAERNKKELNTWYDKLTHQPILILGASISDAEWDLWSAFVNRERNFSKGENQKFRKPIYQMRSDEDKVNSTSKTISNHLWFEPLFSEKKSFHEQWALLAQKFKK